VTLITPAQPEIQSGVVLKKKTIGGGGTALVSQIREMSRGVGNAAALGCGRPSVLDNLSIRRRHSCNRDAPESAAPIAVISMPCCRWMLADLFEQACADGKPRVQVLKSAGCGMMLNRALQAPDSYFQPP